MLVRINSSPSVGTSCLLSKQTKFPFRRSAGDSQDDDVLFLFVARSLFFPSLERRRGRGEEAAEGVTATVTSAGSTHRREVRGREVYDICVRS